MSEFSIQENPADIRADRFLVFIHVPRLCVVEVGSCSLADDAHAVKSVFTHFMRWLNQSHGSDIQF
jgi:hypothetical protein